MEKKLAAIRKNGYSFTDVLTIIQEEIQTRIQKSTESAAQYVSKYFDCKKKALEVLDEFESRVAVADITDSDIMASDVISEGLNPLMNTFQQLMVRQAEIVAYEHLAEAISHCQSIPDFAQAFAVPEAEKGYFERTVYQCATKNYAKVFNVVVSRCAGKKHVE